MSAMVLLTKMHVNVVLHHSDILHLGILRAVTAICLPDRPGLYEQTSFNCVDFRLRSAEHSSELDALLSLARKFAPYGVARGYLRNRIAIISRNRIASV